MVIRVVILLAIVMFSAEAFAGKTLNDTLNRSHVKCGIGGTTHMGFTFQRDDGQIVGFDTDFCRAIALALFNDPTRVEFEVVNNEDRLTNLAKGKYDVLYRTTTWTLTRDAAFPLEFAGINFYDGQGFMVHTDSGVKKLDELKKAKICVNTGTTTHKNLQDYIKKNKKDWTVVTGKSEDVLKGNFFTRECDAYTDDRSGLASIRASDAPFPNKILILPQTISKEPLGPVVRSDDPEWFDIVKWTLLATIEAEELGITSKNIDSFLTSKDPAVQRFIGVDTSLADALGLPAKWAYNIVKGLGNYSEIFERNLGLNTKLGLSRGLNGLWTDGGLMYSPPFR